jgi:hypothetical protein
VQLGHNQVCTALSSGLPLQILDGDKYLWQALGSGLWPVMVLVSEIVQVRLPASGLAQESQRQ